MSPQIINSLLDVTPKYDTIFTDMFGVIWDGEVFFDGVLNTFAALKQMGKKIYIISNATTIGSLMSEKAQRAGLKLGVHFDGFITSGDTLKNKISKGFFEQVANKNDYKFHIIGRDNPMLFQDISHRQTYSLDDADFVYISSLIINNVHPQSLDMFIPDLERALSLKLPAVCANPDFFAFYKELKYYTGGSAAKWYEEHGGTAHWIGKPYVNIFEYAINITRADKQKTVMIGDTLRTDIAGAHNAGLDSILITGRGITADELANGKTLDECYQTDAIQPTYLLDIIK
ncbi:MAG: TIGR01459 family HAD-type hydrolase [Alphaproteobacteria bacterium]|nr:TIGR01459 family HAD-type hydrolase [Alphaproteobacteria bacterium]